VQIVDFDNVRKVIKITPNSDLKKLPKTKMHKKQLTANASAVTAQILFIQCKW
jgi:hypothetical protein